MTPSIPERDHEALREMLGAHALGGLDDGERAELEEHLRACPSCQAELAEIAPLAGPLRGVHAGPAPQVPTTHPSPAGFGAVLGRLQADDRTDGPAAPVVDLAARRRSLLLSVAAAAVVAIVGVGIGYGLGAAGAGPSADPVAVTALAPGVAATAGTVPHTWGVEVVLTGSGFTPGQVYEVAVVDRSGRAVGAGAFVGTGATEMVCRLNSPVLPEQAGGFVVTDASGGEVVRSRFV